MTILRVAIVAGVIGLAGVSSSFAQQAGPPARGGNETGNFGDVPFSNPQLIITRAEDRIAWRKLEDQQLKERRDFEDRYEKELRALRSKQAEEREAALKTFVR